MDTTILWTGREYHSMENCHIEVTDAGVAVTSAIVGYYQDIIYKVDYSIKTNKNWETLAFHIRSKYNGHEQVISFDGDGRGNWKCDGKNQDRFKGCIDVDIPLTPFTNSLPINRMQLKANDSKQIDVIYLDLLGREIKRVKQRYMRLSPSEYHYENVPNDFEAVIMVDESGLVLDYPELFVRTAAYTKI